MEFQVVWRLYESLYVFNYCSTARMHIFGYFTGLYFYTAAAMSLSYNSALEAFTFVAHRVAEFIVKGKNHRPPLEFQWFEYLSPLLHLGQLRWIGAIIFFYGWLHQRRRHAILGICGRERNKLMITKSLMVIGSRSYHLHIILLRLLYMEVLPLLVEA